MSVIRRGVHRWIIYYEEIVVVSKAIFIAEPCQKPVIETGTTQDCLDSLRNRYKVGSSCTSSVASRIDRKCGQVTEPTESFESVYRLRNCDCIRLVPGQPDVRRV